MLAFKAGKIQLLVATTVIEVGVDVPNATLMVIENAERMGLAQLHQLRGRVGRGAEASSCVLLYRAPLSELARERLKVIRETNDGFEIARRDLELRGPGELLGTRQTGLAQLRVADLMRDADLLPQVQQTAELLLAAYPEHIAAPRRALDRRRSSATAASASAARASDIEYGGCACAPGHALLGCACMVKTQFAAGEDLLVAQEHARQRLAVERDAGHVGMRRRRARRRCTVKVLPLRQVQRRARHERAADDVLVAAPA